MEFWTRFNQSIEVELPEQAPALAVFGTGDLIGDAQHVLTDFLSPVAPAGELVALASSSSVGDGLESVSGALEFEIADGALANQATLYLELVSTGGAATQLGVNFYAYDSDTLSWVFDRSLLLDEATQQRYDAFVGGDTTYTVFIAVAATGNRFRLQAFDVADTGGRFGSWIEYPTLKADGVFAITEGRAQFI